MIAFKDNVTTDHYLSTFESNGYLIVKSVIEEDQLITIRKICDEIAKYAELNNSDLFANYYLKHRPDQGVLYDLYQRFPEFSQLARNQVIIDVISDVYSKNFFLYENSLVYKPKGKANGVAWHQDFINRPKEPLKVIAWIALDDISQENGCMYAIPGSHKLGFLPWVTLKGETHHTRVDISKVDTSQAVPLEMSAGDVLIFHQLLLHSSKEVHTELPRRAYRVSYQNFEQSFTPRGTPIVISLKDKSVLSKAFVYKRESTNLLLKGARKVRRILAGL